MNAGRDIVAYGEYRSRCTRRIVLRCGTAARVGTTAAGIRAPRSRAGRDVGKSPALRAARTPGGAPDGREPGSPVRRRAGRVT